jgi:Domain of unknown function (DUF6927)
MGWLYMQSLGGFKSPKDYLDNQFTSMSNRVLKSALVGMRTYYAAVEHTDQVTGEKSVWAAVCLVRYNPRDKDGYVFGYKDMAETMGPVETACPKAILDLLTPTDSEYANDWRAACRLRAGKRMPKIGDTIALAEPLRFSDGSEHKTFKMIKWWKNRTAFETPQGGIYRISNLRDRNFEIM